MMDTPFTWTPENQEILVAMWEQGLLAKEIAAKLGITRGAVNGKARRLNLSYRTVHGGARKSHVKKLLAVTEITLPTQSFSMPEPVKEKIFSRHVDPSVPTWRKTCQYIAGKPTGSDACKCGEPVYGSSAYCSEHRLMVWKPKAADG